MPKNNIKTTAASGKKPMSPKVKKTLRLLLFIGLPAVIAVTVAIVLLLYFTGQPYQLFQEDMGNYFTLTRDDYTGKTYTIDKKYEVTDDMVEAYISQVLSDNRGTSISKPVALGDTVGVYIRASVNGRPLVGHAVPSHFTALSTQNADGSLLYSYNYFMDAPVEIKLGEGDGLPEAVRNAILGQIPKESTRKTSVGVKLYGNETIFMTYYAYYLDAEGKQVYLEDEMVTGLLVDLSEPTENSVHKSAVGRSSGDVYILENHKKREIDGVMRDITYACRIERTLDEERAIITSEVLPDDAFSADSPYRELNGQTITYYIVLAGTYTMPVLDANFILYRLNYKTDEADVVAAYRRAVKEALIQRQKEQEVYAILWAIASSEWRPSSYPEKLTKEIEQSVSFILSDPEFIQNYETAGFDSAEKYIRQTFGLTGELYDSMPLKEALSHYIYAVKNQEMLYYFFIQKENISYTEEEYRVYLERRTAEMQEEFGSPMYSMQYVEEYYDRQYGTGFFGTGFLRECLTYEKIAEFLYQNNTIEYKEMENAQ